MWRAWRAIAFLLVANTGAHAATIDVVSLGSNDPSLVRVSGPLESTDTDLFLRKILSLSNAFVAFDSDGGSLAAGIQIGETIRLKNFSTLVPNGKRCAWSCALAWLGGTRRFMGTESKIGFHSAYNGDTGQVTGPGNALVGAYLNKIGLPYNAIIYITSASPESMTWLSKTDAENLGIEVSLFQPRVPIARDPSRKEKNGETQIPKPGEAVQTTDIKPTDYIKDTRLSQSELDAMRARLATLWIVKPGVEHPEELFVTIRIRLTPDRRLASPPQVMSNGSSARYKAAAEAAVKAVVQGQPYTMLRDESYEQWKYMDIDFDPKQIFRDAGKR